MESKKAVFINLEYEVIREFDKEFSFYNDDDQSYYLYWTDNEKIYWRTIPIKNADLNSFRYYCDIFAKDNKRCYLQGKCLKDADAQTFTALNPCFAKDKNYVWTLGGKVEVSDIESFEVCDEGLLRSSMSQREVFDNGYIREIPIIFTKGYAKDKNNVYVETLHGKVKIVKNANPKTFKSFNIGDYGYDDKYVFYEQYILPKADPATWQLMNKNDNRYSKDDKTVFFLNKIIDADIDSFEVVELMSNLGYKELIAKDKNSYFEFDERMADEDFDRRFSKKKSS